MNFGCRVGHRITLQDFVFIRILLIELPETNKFFRSYGYQLAGNGRWQSMTLKRAKKAGKGGKRKAASVQQGEPEYSDEDDGAVSNPQVIKDTEVRLHSYNCSHRLI